MKLTMDEYGDIDNIETEEHDTIYTFVKMLERIGKSCDGIYGNEEQHITADKLMVMAMCYIGELYKKEPEDIDTELYHLKELAETYASLDKHFTHSM